jgi:branched-chain amino acid transport system substrate-binding protein
MKKQRWGALGALVAVTAVAVAALASTAATGAQQPIKIGWAFDAKGQMAPFDNPALAAAQQRVKLINSRGGVGGRPLAIETCDTQNNKPVRAKACATRLLGNGAAILFTTCDVEFAAPAAQEALNRGILAIAPCIGTDQMGPKRFGAKGKLAFSYGNAAQDEGAAMAEYARRKGWKTAALATNNLLVYFKNVVQAFEQRFKQRGGKIVAKESYTSFANDVQNAVSRINNAKADVYVTATAFGELPAFVSGIRSLGNQTPIMNSWAGDGTYWLPKGVNVTNYYFVTFASVFGDDPNPAVKKMIADLTKAKQQPFTGGFLAGAAAIDGVVTAINRSKGSTNGATLAAAMEKFRKVPTLSGLVNFSPSLHTVFGRQYRVIRIHNNKAKRVAMVTASSPAKIG